MRALLGLFAAALALCLTTDRNARADAVIAVAAPLSGRHESMGDYVRRAARAAIERLNANGGVLGERVSIFIADDGCEQADALVAAESVIARQPALVVGHPCSNAAVAAAAAYAAAGLVFISPGARHGALTAARMERTMPRASATIFRLAGRDDRQGEAAARWLTSAAPGRRIVLVHDGSNYARGIVQEAERSLKGNDIASVPVLAIVAGREDYGNVAARIAALNAEAVFFAGYPIEAAIILRGLRRSVQSARFLGSDTLASEAFGEASGAGSDNVRLLLPSDPGPRSTWRPREIADLARYSAPSRALMARTFGAIEAWAIAATKAGSLAPDAVCAALAEGSVETSSLGEISFDENGDARIPSYVAAGWDGTRWVSGN